MSGAEASQAPTSSAGTTKPHRPKGSSRPTARQVDGGDWASVALGRERQLPKASAMLAAELRAYILGHALAPGSTLPSEAELIASTSLGRATVREALRLLEAEGLIAIKRGPQGGVVVRRPDLSGLSRSLAPFLTLTEAPLRDLFAFRKAVEPWAASLAAEHATDAQRARLIELAGHHPGPGYRNEIAFHVLVAECAANQVLRALLVVPHDLLRLHLEVDEIPDDAVEEANNAHLAIAKHISSGDQHRAGRAMLKHLESFEEMMQRQGRLDQPIVPRTHWLRRTSVHSFSS